MTIPASGPISMSAIRSEFTGPTPSNLGAYYRGGTYVNVNTAAGTNGLLPTSGVNSFSRYRGITKYVAAPQSNITGAKNFFITEGTPSDGNPPPLTVTFASNGQVILGGFSGNSFDTWAEPVQAGAGSGWYVNFAIVSVSGSANIYPTNSWQNLFSNKTLFCEAIYSGAAFNAEITATLGQNIGGSTYMTYVTHHIYITFG